MDPFAALADPVRRGLLTEAGLTVVEERGRERHCRLVPVGLDPVRDFVETPSGADGTVRFAESALDALALEVRRTVRDRAGHEITTEETG